MTIDLRISKITHISDEAAQHGVAVDRFAREIVGFLKASAGALAATERQPVRRRTLKDLIQ